MKCDDYQGLLQDYVTRQLDPARRRLVDAHLLECSECQRELAVLTALVSALDHQPIAEPSTAFTEKVLATLPRQRTFVPSPWWALALAPVLGVVAWFARVPVTRELEVLLIRSGLSHISVPAVSLQQAGLAVLAAVLAGMAVAVGAGAYVWQVYLRD